MSSKARSVSGFFDKHVDSQHVSVAERRFWSEASTENSLHCAYDLVAVAGTHGNAFAPFGATAGKHCCAGLGLHPGQKAVCLRTVAAVRLECALGHNAALLISLKNLCLKASFKYNGFSQKGQTS
jgi:hypothetical protein